MQPFILIHSINHFLSCAELEILAHGLHLLLIDPYNKPQLKVRYPGTAEYKEVRAYFLKGLIRA